MLNSLAVQSVYPHQLILIDASNNFRPEMAVSYQQIISKLNIDFQYVKAIQPGAALQRQQGLNYATQDYILFCDDDIIFEVNCLQLLWNAIQSNLDIGGVNAMITNQKYTPPGKISSMLFWFLNGRHESSYAGKCIGPAMNFLPEDREDLPEVVPVEWLNTTCVLYRRKVLPEPLFPEVFTGYSLMEDVTLSLMVGKKWRLANARTARIFHDSQPGDHKNNPGVLAEMDLVNRHYVMTKILSRYQWHDYLKLAVLQIFGIVASLTKVQGWINLPKVLTAKIRAISQILNLSL
ncbi:MAG: glycosyltransferase [Sphaerospermopsis sp. SIO1G2]|nr:glycosyltransferase [Sphaerospermopsis sp. SIO1G2]